MCQSCLAGKYVDGDVCKNGDCTDVNNVLAKDGGKYNCIREMSEHLKDQNDSNSSQFC